MFIFIFIVSILEKNREVIKITHIFFPLFKHLTIKYRTQESHTSTQQYTILVLHVQRTATIDGNYSTGVRGPLTWDPEMVLPWRGVSPPSARILLLRCLGAAGISGQNKKVHWHSGFHLYFYTSNVLPQMGKLETGVEKMQEKWWGGVQNSEEPKKVNLNITLLTALKMTIFINWD